VTLSGDEAGNLPEGVSVGHWTDLAGQTGCTVILAPGGAVGGVDVRGGAPGTLGTDGLHPGRVIQEVHAVCTKSPWTRNPIPSGAAWSDTAT